MKIINYILNAAGFSDYHDLLGYAFTPLTGIIFSFSVAIGSVIGFIEMYSGISVLLWVFMTAAAILDLVLGIYTNIFYLKRPYQSERMFRGLMKGFILMCVIFLTNIFKMGVEESNITPKLLGDAAAFTTASIHYTSVLFIGIYILLGIAENGAKMKMKVFESIVKVLNTKIKRLENDDEK